MEAMRWRALLLALALAFGSTTSMEAKPKQTILRGKAAAKASKKATNKARKASKRMAKKSKAYKLSKGSKVKPRKAPKHSA